MRHFTTPTIIGGWAVYFYNSYFGSVDIDIVSPSYEGEFAQSIETYERDNGYKFKEVDALGLQVVPVKEVFSENGKKVGEIEIDMCTFEDPAASCFREDSSKALPYALCGEPRHRKEARISDDCVCYVPRKTLLILYKLKALRDRTYQFNSQGHMMRPERAEWLRSKIVKDQADIIALLDPSPRSYMVEDSLDRTVFDEITSKFEITFVTENLSQLPTNDQALRLYSPDLARKELERWLEALVHG